MRKHLSEPYYSQVKSGLKTIEGRIDKNDYSEGLQIEFWNGDDSFLCAIEKIRRYSSFEEMIKSEGIAKVLPGVFSTEEGVAVYRKFFTEDDEKKGVLALQIRLL